MITADNGRDSDSDAPEVHDDTNRGRTSAPSADCECGPCLRHYFRQTRYQAHEAREADREYRGLIA